MYRAKFLYFLFTAVRAAPAVTGAALAVFLVLYNLCYCQTDGKNNRPGDDNVKYIHNYTSQKCADIVYGKGHKPG